MVPKATGAWRLIIHLSFILLLFCIVFYFVFIFIIDPLACSVKCTAFDDMVEMLANLVTGTKLTKMYLKYIFRSLRVHPGDFDLLDFHFNAKCYIGLFYILFFKHGQLKKKRES